MNSKLTKNKHRITSYRSYRNFDENNFLADLASDLDTFKTINQDTVWSTTILKHLNEHAPIKTRRFKTKRLPDWFTPEISLNRKLRYNCKQRQQWDDYRKYRNKTRPLIRTVKRKYFSESISKSTDTKHIWAHLRALNGDAKASGKTYLMKLSLTINA